MVRFFGYKKFFFLLGKDHLHSDNISTKYYNMRRWQVRGKCLENLFYPPKKEHSKMVHPVRVFNLSAQLRSIINDFFNCRSHKKDQYYNSMRNEICSTASIKVSISSVEVFCFVIFFPTLGSPCLLRLADLQVIMVAFYTHSLAFTSGHARKVSIPGFFQQLP